MRSPAQLIRLPFSRVRSKLSERSGSWIKKRQGADALHVTLHRRRIYILPTKSGLLYAAVVFMLLIGSLNYANNMGFILTFLLTGVGLVAMHHSHRNLAGLKVSFTQVEPVFAGQDAQFEFVIENPERIDRWQLCSGWNSVVTVCGDIDALDRAKFSLPLGTTHRGWLACPRIGLSTTYPLGLFRAWAWVHMDLHALVYPQPLDRVDFVRTANNESGQNGINSNGEDEFSGLREYRRGDSPRSIAWKSAASLGTLLVKEYREGGQTPLWIEWNSLSHPDSETRLAAMCRLVLDADSNQLMYGLRLPDVAIPPAKGHTHLHHCLRELAMFGDRKV